MKLPLLFSSAAVKPLRATHPFPPDASDIKLLSDDFAAGLKPERSGMFALDCISNAFVPAAQPATDAYASQNLPLGALVSLDRANSGLRPFT